MMETKLANINTEPELRPWGSFIKFLENSPCTVKVLNIKKNQKTSYQYHKNRFEFVYVLRGNMTVITTGEFKELGAGGFYSIEPNIAHRYIANEDTSALEISLGEFREADIIRIDDEYGRVS